MIKPVIENFKTSYVIFYSKGRPNNCMCIYITQQFSEVQPKSIRENCSNIILFKTAGCSFDKVYSDNGT